MKNHHKRKTNLKYYATRTIAIAIIIFCLLYVALIRFQDKEFSWTGLFNKENIGITLVLLLISAMLSIITTRNNKDNEK